MLGRGMEKQAGTIMEVLENGHCSGDRGDKKTLAFGARVF